MQVRLSPKRTHQTQGIALVVVLLSAMILMVSLLAISATMTISSQRTTADQSVTLPAQYAAEAGLARATMLQTEIQSVMQQISIPTGQSSNTINGHIRNFCGGTFNNPLPSSDDGPVLCTIPTPTPSYSNRYSLFANTAYLPLSAYPSGITNITQYWQSAFGGSAPTAFETKVSQNGTAESWYKVAFGLQPTRVVQRAADNYRLFFTVSDVTSIGEVRAGSQIVASRQLQQTTQPNPNTALTASGEYYIDIFNPSFSRYVQFRDHTNQTVKDGGRQLFFGAGEQFDGPVHTNEQPGFIGSSTTNPLFTDEFTTAATRGTYSGLSTADHARMFPNTTPRFNAGEVDITENRYSQLRAAMGGDENDTSTITNSDLRGTWGIGENGDRNKVMPDGVYFSEGNNNNKANNTNSWVGDPAKPSGIYVKGNADALKFSKTDNTATGRQVIEITQAGNTTRFEQRTDGRWDVKEQNGSTRTLSGSFNGMIYVDGDVSSLGGDGSTDNDIAASSQMTLASTGNVIIKDDITYTDNPLDPNKGNVKNVLGIYTNGGKCGLTGAIASCGSVELDGTVNKDLTVHATIMASKDGQGFGTLNCGGEGCPNKGTVYDATLRANRQVRINVLGGVVESQSQTVSSGSNGYRRVYSYDKRFKSGFTPPFFPKRANWQAETAPFSSQQQVWQAVKQ